MITGIVGLGNMGSTVANHIARNGNPVWGWDYDRSVLEEIASRRSNTAYLPGISLHESLKPSGLEDVCRSCDIVFIALPSVFIRQTLVPVAGLMRPGTVLVNLAKGIEHATGKTSFQILEELFPSLSRFMLSGPAIANEIARGMPAAVVLAGTSQEPLVRISRLLDNETFATIHSTDVIGTELGGILKNIYAIGLGLLDGIGVSGINFRSVYISRALHEMSDAGTILGGRRETFFGIAGLGDLLATSLSEHSHNRRMGELLGRDSTVEDIRMRTGLLPEGYNTLKVMLPLVARHGCAMPIAESLSRVIDGLCPAREFVSTVLRQNGVS